MPEVSIGTKEQPQYRKLSQFVGRVSAYFNDTLRWEGPFSIYVGEVVEEMSGLKLGNGGWVDGKEGCKYKYDEGKREVEIEDNIPGDAFTFQGRATEEFVELRRTWVMDKYFVTQILKMNAVTGKVTTIEEKQPRKVELGENVTIDVETRLYKEEGNTFSKYSEHTAYRLTPEDAAKGRQYDLSQVL